MSSPLPPSSRFQPLVPDEDSDNIWCYENAAMFLFSNFQYLILALVLSSGPPYRQPTYCNREQRATDCAIPSKFSQWYSLSLPLLCPLPLPSPPLQCT